MTTNQFTSEIELLNESHKALHPPAAVQFLKKSGFIFLEYVSYAFSISFVAAFIWITKNLGDFKQDVYKIKEIIMDGTTHLEMQKVLLMNNYELLYYGLIIATVLLVVFSLLMGASFSAARKRISSMSEVSVKIQKVKESLENKSFTQEVKIEN